MSNELDELNGILVQQLCVNISKASQNISDFIFDPALITLEDLSLTLSKSDRYKADPCTGKILPKTRPDTVIVDDLEPNPTGDEYNEDAPGIWFAGLKQAVTKTKENKMDKQQETPLQSMLSMVTQTAELASRLCCRVTNLEAQLTGEVASPSELGEKKPESSTWHGRVVEELNSISGSLNRIEGSLNSIFDT